MSYSAQRPQGREHIPFFPKGWIAIRIVQLVLAMLILGLAAYGIATFPTSGNEYILAVAIMTLVTSSYHIVCEFTFPKAYNYWAILGLDIFLVIMWLASFALLASDVSILFYYLHGFDSYLYSNYVNDYASSVPACLAVAAALGGAQFALHIASLTVHGIRLHRHRAAGFHCTPGAPRTAPLSNLTTTATSMPGAEKNSHPQHYTQPFPPSQPLAPYPPTQPLAPYPPTQPLQPYPPTQPLNYYPGQQQAPIQLYGGYVPQQGQVPIAVNTTGGSQQYYQQGPSMPVFEQRTGGSVASPGEQQQQQSLPVTQPQQGSTELPASQIRPQQQ